ncbi:DUF5709 domain-containing protein [Streptomyces sp. NBC_01476]|uniref:DUF5709 domain-containing protein n=1 Tax=Streptomyces sp. NBC_01476 TaxID=2903881 RepID=UPI002E34BA05|nr:DUF5709 domain-containing protein [Streptomyces sp. NBC_01476]
MTTQDDGIGLDGTDDPGLLPPEEGLDDEETDGYQDQGYSPVERPLAVAEWGLTAREAASHEDLGHRLDRELKDDDAGADWDGLGDSPDSDGELIDGEVGDVRAGRLTAWDSEDTGLGRTEADYWARDIGIDGGAASAEEAAVHIVPDTDGDAY